MSFLRRIWQSIRNPRLYVGRDLEGNSFYEYPASSPDPRRTKRVVKYRSPDDVWDYIGGGKRLPAQWSSWLTHTRRLPPTLEELQADLERQQRVKINSALIDARDNENRAKLITEGAAAVEEAQRMGEIANQTSRLQYHQVTTDGDHKELREDIHSNQGQEGERTPKSSASPLMSRAQSIQSHSPWVEHTEDTLKPQSWTPSTRRRRE